MSDISVKVIADKLGKSLENLSSRLEEELNSAVGNLAKAAYASMIAQIQATQMGNQNRQALLGGLEFTEMGDNSYMITLNGDWANKLESGYPGYSIKDKLLSSDAKVKSGPRAGQPWVQTSKQGTKFAHVPFDQKVSAPSSGDLTSEIKKIMATNSKGTQQKLTKVFKDELGRPISGKVASVKNAPGNLSGITKYQRVDDKGKVSSYYLTFRTVSEKSSGWQHPGFPGYNFFKRVEEEVEKELENILKTLL